MIQLSELSGTHIGDISEEQLTFLSAQIGGEDGLLEGQAYYINGATIDLFEEIGADRTLVSLLQKALGDRDDMDIRWDLR